MTGRTAQQDCEAAADAIIQLAVLAQDEDVDDLSEQTVDAFVAILAYADLHPAIDGDAIADRIDPHGNGADFRDAVQ